MTTKPTCAALIGNNTRCKKAKQCARAVAWYDEPGAAFNLCMPHGRGTFKHFLSSSATQAVAAPLKPQMDLFA